MDLKLYRRWWLLLLKGVFTFGLGLSLFLIPEISIQTFSQLSGVFIGIGGVFMLSGSLSHRRYNCEWTWWLIEGGIDLLFSVLLIFFTIDSISVMVILISLWIIIMGMIQMVTAINIQYYMPSNYLFYLLGVFGIIIGILILIRPYAALESVVWLFAIFAIVYGLMQGYLSFRLQKIVIEEIGNIEDLYL